MSEPTTPAGTPAAGRPYPAIRHRLAATAGQVICDECGTTYDAGAECCPGCVQRRRRRGGGLEAVTETFDSDHPWTTVERSDALDGTRRPDTEDGEAEGWPW
ncbi:MAG: hypothetical protein ACRDYV_14415 [Acidimicrobiia bacterium]